MGLLPEFLTLLGIVVFLAMSLLSALLDDELPSLLQYLLQGAAAVGLGELLVARAFVNAGVLAKDPADPTRFWISVGYLTAAVISVVGLNTYLGIARRKTALATTFAGAVTVPIMMVSAFFISSFLTTSGNASVTLGSISVLGITALITTLSIIGFLRQAGKHTEESLAKTNEPPFPSQPETGTPNLETDSSNSPSPPAGFLELLLPTMQRQWEESSKQERGDQNQT